MASHLVGQHPVLPFNLPVFAGLIPVDPNVVRSQDNVNGTTLTAHDADATVHVQDGTAAVRAALPTFVAGRKWIDSDTYRFYFDDGSAWHELVSGSSVGILTFGTHLTSGGASYNGSADVTITSDATASDTASTIVARDANGQTAVSVITVSTGTITASTPGVAVTQTWNSAGVTFVGATMNITNTASTGAAAGVVGSLLEQWKVGGVNQLLITRAGGILSASSGLDTLVATMTGTNIGPGAGGVATAVLNVYRIGGIGVGGVISVGVAEGTAASPTAIVTGHVMGAYCFRAADSATTMSGTGSQNTACCAIHAITGENWTTTAHGAGLQFMCTPNGAVANVVAFSLGGDKSAVFGGVARLKGFTVATLPAGVVGDTAYATDLAAPGFLVAAVGGGAVVGPVFFNGAAWVAY